MTPRWALWDYENERWDEVPAATAPGEWRGGHQYGAVAFTDDEISELWLVAMLASDAVDTSRDPMWRYGVRHALSLVRDYLRVPAAAAAREDDPGTWSEQWAPKR